MRVDGSGRPIPCNAVGSDKTILARIIVIAADALIRETLKTMLQMEGHEVALAPHGAEGPRHLREQAVDLVISDIFMGRGGGTETVAAIRQSSPDVPIITIVGGAGDIPDSRDQDYPRYLQMMHLVDATTTTIAKPFKPRDLFALIRHCLDDAGPSTN